MIFRDCRNYYGHSVEKVVSYVRRQLSIELEKNRYEYQTAEVVQNAKPITSPVILVIEGQCYVGITSNPVQSLTAHGINIFASNTYFCTDIQKEDAQRCKEAVTELEGYEAVCDPENDRSDTPYPQLYLYIYKISDNTNEKPEISNLTPIEDLPEGRNIVRFVMRNGSADVRILPEINEKLCNDLITEIREGISSQQLAEVWIRHRELNMISVLFGDGCCIINYDAGTSQMGGYQSYRSGATSRRKVQLYSSEYPEYMLCRDMQVLEVILQYFLLKGKKPGKRQNIKWVNMKYDGWD
ncbi:hypothetical protein [Ruminococcus flavefaciens]|uniref:Uncharacterized protein n=1 Tax=Ruminococcus flavefaciens TaxID=1265 RepID=A0A1K1P9E3_RUMFL|nr:hypothetical protein [Ruminococcus flavefaciens]SFW44069.1 hypothetical protein SAMN02910280_2595 [Ruminococcus flavefaciens]